MLPSDAVATVTVSTDPDRVDLDAVHAFPVHSDGARGIPRATLARALAHSVCASAWADGAQVGFARMVSDHATFAYLADVYVLPPHRGRGLARRLVTALLGHPDLQGLRRMLLATRDAHRVYAALGFTPLAASGRFMERHDPLVYQRGAA